MSDAVFRIPEAQRDSYRRWLATLSVTTRHGQETVIAWDLARKLGLPPLRVLRATRGQKGQEDIHRRVDDAINSDPSVRYFRDARGVRRTRYTERLQLD